MTRGDQFAFPQSPCPSCHGDGRGVVGYGKDSLPLYGECSTCHGTGLVGGGLTVREWYIGKALKNVSVEVNVVRGTPGQHAGFEPSADEVAKAAIEIADAVLARMEAGNG